MASPALLVERREEGVGRIPLRSVLPQLSGGHARGEVGGINRMHNLRRRPL